MKTRIDYLKTAPAVVQAMFALNKPVAESTLEHPLLLLVKLRASLINGCGMCIDMHTKDARAEGETEQRLYLVSAWREAPHLYSDRERAALAWTESLTNLTDGFVPDEVYEAVRPHFSEAELAALTLAVVAINGWNRLNVALRTPAGAYEPGMFKKLKLA